MASGLVWLSLLLVFVWLAGLGWNEYQKVEAYRRWAAEAEFEKSKYDIYAVLAKKGNNLTWGKPTRTGTINQSTFSLNDVQSINLVVDDRLVDIELPPSKGRKVALEFSFAQPIPSVRVPFTEIPLAAEWGKYLSSQLTSLRI
ncbi:hypothetical protein [Synechocystis sp. PCC 7509]|uniref:hypothetical protein n=1 Tax=Synechocystis sp. PCC 7509 TaxID=927677 RepID=UPI0002ABF6AF|nr:hypothetical protein [Synechocystis sp. PCC 7509]